MIRFVAFAGVLFLYLMVGQGLAETKTYIIGVEEIGYYPHYDFKEGAFTGFGRDFLDAFARWKGIHFKYKGYPIKRLARYFMKDRKTDFRYPDNPYWDQKIKKCIEVHYSAPIIGYTDGVVVLPENKGKGIETLRNLGTIRGFNPWPYYKFIDDGRVKINETVHFKALLEMVLYRHVDGGYINVDIADYQLREVLKRTPDSLIFDPGLPHIESFYHLSTMNYPEIVKEVETFLSEEKDLIIQLKKKYGF